MADKKCCDIKCVRLRSSNLYKDIYNLSIFCEIDLRWMHKYGIILDLNHITSHQELESKHHLIVDHENKR